MPQALTLFPVDTFPSCLPRVPVCRSSCLYLFTPCPILSPPGDLPIAPQIALSSRRGPYL
ncbi:uncharacterized protein SCHCODRAFT_02621587 [Schizophyllum commune H4-8]|uniref:uncharacterized protein n=1 Tax=Schizophyllum commune (strain H4-8 / FGSC 9210) TaxID=578458 RepID=UPI0021604352|nr:uncharacterized protein SCHCODRAFT_02621587 [Schizophyllum commune H4-8]KAI5893362.1 hypothetical protein SCHCODRAFT_02621587 [Schizophyllum commune H4-8]